MTAPHHLPWPDRIMRLVILAGFAAQVVLWVSSCDESAAEASPVTSSVKIEKTRFTVAFHDEIHCPGGQPNFYLSELHDTETGIDYIIVQSGSTSTQVMQVPSKPAEKPAQ